MEIERPDIGGLVLKHRDAAGLTQLQLATQAGLSQGALSAIERNLRDPSLGALCRVLDVLDLTLRVEAEGSRESLDAAIDVALARRPADRLSHGRARAAPILDALEPAAPVVDGVAGAAVHGAPVPVDHVDVIVAEAAADALAAGLWRLGGDRWSNRWRQWGPEHPDPRRPGAMRWRTLSGEVRVRLVDELPPAVTVLLGEQRIAVRPLHDIEADHPVAARALARLRERLSGSWRPVAGIGG